jgi:DNA invertase Pin-like site-specific DNA recombinase
MNAAIYARKSNDQTGVNEDARSVTRQIERGKAFAVKNG